MRTPIAFVCFVTLAVVAGCGASHVHERLGTEIPGNRLEPGPRVRVATLPQPCRAVELSLVTPSARIDPALASALGTSLRQALAETSAFDRVTLLGEGAERAPVRVEVAPASYALEDAPGEGAVSAIVAYLFIGPWTDWFHDRDCRLQASFTATLRDAASGRVLARVPCRGSATEALSFWERRGGFWPAFGTVCWVPPMAFDTDEARVRPLLAPRALEAPAFAIVDALSRVKAREVEGTYAKGYSLDGLAASFISPVAGVTRTAQIVTLRLSGEETKNVRKVWIGDKVVFDAATAGPAPAKELLVGRQGVALDAKRSLLVAVQLHDLPPIVVGEVGMRKTWTLGE